MRTAQPSINGKHRTQQAGHSRAPGWPSSCQAAHKPQTRSAAGEARGGGHRRLWKVPGACPTHPPHPEGLQVPECEGLAVWVARLGEAAEAECLGEGPQEWGHGRARPHPRAAGAALMGHSGPLPHKDLPSPYLLPLHVRPPASLQVPPNADATTAARTGRGWLWCPGTE